MNIGNDGGEQIKVLGDGLLVMTRSLCNYNQDFCYGLMKFDFDGHLQWKTIVYDTLATNYWEPMVVRNDAILVNMNYVSDVPNLNYSVLAFDMQGNYLERFDYWHPGQQGYHWARGMEGLGNRLFVNFGFKDLGTGISREGIRAYDANWNLLWERYVPNTYPNPLWCDTDATPDGGVVAIYSSWKNPGHKGICTIEKYDAEGDIEWTTVLPHEYNSFSSWVKIDRHPDGGYVGTWKIDTFGLFIWTRPNIVFKLDAAGQVEWEKVEYHEQYNFWGLFAAQNGDIIGCGVAEDFANDTIEDDEYFVGYVSRFKPNGELRWKRKVFDHTGGGYRYEFYNGAEMPNGDLVFTGQMWDTIYGTADDPYPDDVWLVKLDSNGCFSPGCGEEQHLVAAKEPQQSLREQPFVLFPNPFSEQITLASILGRHIPQGEYRAVLYDMNGQIIRQQSFNPNLLTYFDTGDAPPGAYILAVYKDGVLMQTLKAVKP